MQSKLISTDQHTLTSLCNSIRDNATHLIGFPAASDFDIAELEPFDRYMLNNIGDPYIHPLYANHTMPFEREVVDYFAGLFRAPAEAYWGYATTGGTEGNLYGMYLARERYPDARLYYSEAAHYSIAKNAHILRLAASPIATQTHGEMDYAALTRELVGHSGQPAIIVATLGTTMTEARDDLHAIKTALEQAGIHKYYLHVDGALSGAYAPFISPRPVFDFADGADSISVSGHKFLGSPAPCGIVIVRQAHRDLLANRPNYIGSPDATISGSRSGHAPLYMWHAIKRWGTEGLRQRYRTGHELAAYTCTALRERGINAWHNEQSLTVMLPAPEPSIVHRWQLATHKGWSHVIAMPGITRKHIDAFLTDLDATQSRSRSQQGFTALQE